MVDIARVLFNPVNSDPIIDGRSELRRLEFGSSGLEVPVRSAGGSGMIDISRVLFSEVNADPRTDGRSELRRLEFETSGLGALLSSLGGSDMVGVWNSAHTREGTCTQ